MEGRKRKPLSDISNTYNLIPTSALRKLVAASTNSNSFSKPPLSILKSTSSSTNQKLCSESSNRSETSIGSSNVGGTSNSRTVQFRTPPRAISSIITPGGMRSKDAAYNRKQITEKITKEREDDVVILSPMRAEKRKNKGKAIAVPFSSSAPEKLKDNQNEVCNPGSLLEREKQKGEAYFNLSSGTVEIVKETDKGTLNSYNRSSGKTEKGKEILNSSGFALGKHEGMGKGIAVQSSCSFEKTDDGKKWTRKHSGSSNDGKKGISKQSGSSIVKKKEIGKEFVNLSSFSVEKTKDKGKPLSPFDSLLEKTREKGKAILQPSNVVEVTKHKGSSAAVAINGRPPRRKSGKRKNDAGASSCPPILRTKILQNDLDEAGDIKSSKSWTDPRPKLRKKRCSRNKDTSELPRDFIEQQRAYFKEVDEFELPEEEISQDELD
ncbi:hypothetical protein DH2020_044271 [Rehmannia glutinosa]|uniref:Sororin C-terminal region domain-containing protein n=1 Tax=Rehmannia glutinosa TaxID=99300 RepID=A0ABR0UHD6_REHGL